MKPLVVLRRSAALAALVLALAGSAHAAVTRLTGQVVDAATQKPVPSAEIEVQNSGGGPGFWRARTDAKGEFTIEQVPSERWYTITAGAAGYTDWVVESWQFPAAQREARLIVPLERAGRLVVKVTGGGGRGAVSGARVQIARERAAAWWESSARGPEPVWTGRDGEASFDGLAAGYWTVSVDAEGLRSAEARRVAVRQGEATPVALALTKPASLSGVVRLPDSTGAAGVAVMARGPQEAATTTDAEGTFTLGDLAPGRYRIEVQYDGFEPGAARDGLVVQEGEARSGLTLRAVPKPPALAWVMHREVFAPASDDPNQPRPRVGLRTFRIGRLEATLWRVPSARLLDPRRDVRALADAMGDTAGLERVKRWTHSTREGAPYAWREEEVVLPSDLAPGVYLLQGKAGRLERRVVFFVSDLSLVVKRSGTRTLVWAGSMKTGVPVAGAAVFVVGAGEQSSNVGSGADWLAAIAAAKAQRRVTGPDGLLELPGAAASYVRLVAASDANGVAVVESPLAAAARGGAAAMFTFTERPIYRPGQTVYWKAIARRERGQAWQIPDRTSVSVSVSGPDGASVDAAGAALSAHGSADGAFTIPTDAPLGDWTVSTSSGDASGGATFAVQEYRKPEFRVDVSPERDVVVNGDEVRFRVAADYFFGAPVQGARVRYNLFETRLVSADASEWEESEEGGGYGRLLRSGETRTDADGRASLLFAPERASADRRLTLEVEVVDGAQRMVSGRGSLIVGRGLFTIELRPVSPMTVKGSPVRVDVITRDHKGQPVSAAVTVDLDQDVWNPLERRMTRASRPLSSVQATTSAREGRTRITVPPATARAGLLQMRARAEDARGNRITAETSFWVYDPTVWEYPVRWPSLDVVPERTTLAPGDTARLLITTDQRDATVLATLEGRELRDVQVVHLFGNTAMVRFPIRAEDAPNAFVSVHVRRGAEVQSRVIELTVDAGRHDLRIAVTPDKPQYGPGEEARFTLETRDAAGRPQPAEVSLGVVDEAIYSLRADDTPDPHDVFYGRRPNVVTTVVSFPTLYYGGADKGGQDAVRKDFRDVAHWAPAVQTGADGRAEVKFRFPDNLTTWRATARGVTDATLVGDTTAKVRVTKELVARLAVPRRFVAGDEAQLVSVLNNRSDKPVTGVQEAVTVTGEARVVGAATATSSLAANGESRSRWTLALPAESPKDGSDAKAVLTFRATSKTDRDALEQTVAVTPRAVALRPRGAGVLDAASASVEVALPADLVRSGSDVELSLTGSLAGLALDATDWLNAYPWGCTEQTANAILPAAALLRAAKTAGVTLPGWEDPAKRLAPYVQRLAALRGDRGWGWWGDGEPDPYLTALAVDALVQAAALGVEEGTARAQVSSATYALGSLMQEVRSADGEAYMLMHLAPMFEMREPESNVTELLEPAKAMAAGLAAQKDRLSTAGLACASLACARLGMAAEARALFGALGQRGVRDGNGLSFPPDDPEAWFGDGVENTAYALSALARLAPADPRGPEIVRSLATRRRGREWTSTRVTAPVAIALADWIAAHPEEARGAGNVQAGWNGEATWSGVLGGAGKLGAATTVRLSGAKLRAGANTLTLARDGAGPLYWSWSARANVPSPGPAANEPRLQIRREYLRAARTTDRRGRPQWLASPLDPAKGVAVGEALIVRLTLTAPKALRWLMIEDPRPSGFELDPLDTPGLERPWAMHAESRDDRTAFFVDRLESGETRIEYLIRPEIGGTFTALPTSAGSMYDPALLVRGAEAKLRVSGPTP